MRSQEIEGSELYSLVVKNVHQDPLIIRVVSTLAKHDIVTRQDLVITPYATLEGIFRVPDRPQPEPVSLVFARSIKAAA